MSGDRHGVSQVPSVKRLDLQEVQHEVNQENGHQVVRPIEFTVVEVVIEGPKFGDMKIKYLQRNRIHDVREDYYFQNDVIDLELLVLWANQEPLEPWARSLQEISVDVFIRDIRHFKEMFGHPPHPYLR